MSDSGDDGDTLNNKRRKIKNNNDKFGPGSVMKIRVKNFTTYSYGEFDLLPTLNMIIGPNGSGKSTLVSAICVGLGGKLELIKRKSLKSMITTGQTDAWVEITLKNTPPKNPLVIKRSFNEKSSVWYVNGAASDERNVRRICKSFNIQLNNLCHFLPQERVAEFAGLLPEKLLIETERTVESGKLLELHEDLIRNDEEREELKSTLSSYEKRLNTLSEEKHNLELEVQKFEEYQEKTRVIKLHLMLLPYAQLQDLKEGQRAIKRERDNAKKALEKFIGNMKPLQDQIRSAKQRLVDQELQLLDMRSKYQVSILSYDLKKEDLSKNSDTILGLKLTKKNIVTKSKSRKEELDSMKEEKDRLIDRLNELPQLDETLLIKKKELRDAAYESVNDLRSKMENIQDKINDIKNQLKGLESQKQIYELKLLSNDKIILLEPNGRYRSDLLDNAYGSHIFLRLKPEFKGLYYEAPIVSCDVVDKCYAKFIEKVIDNNTLFSLTITSQEAYDRIHRVLFTKFNAPLRVTKNIASDSPISKDKLAQLGFEGFLSDFLTGPKEVLNMLNVVSKLNCIPVSRSSFSEKQLAKLLNPDSNGGRLPFMRFVAGDNLFTVSRSRYGRQQFFYTTEQVLEARFFGVKGLTSEAKEEFQRKLVDVKAQYERTKSLLAEEGSELEKLAEKLNESSAIFNGTKNDVDALQNLKKNRSQLSTYIQLREERIKKLERDRLREYKEKIRVLEGNILDKYKTYEIGASELSKHLTEMAGFSISIEKKELILLELKNMVHSLERLVELFRLHKLSLEAKYHHAKDKYDRVKKSDAAKKVRQQNESYSKEERERLSALAEKYLNEGHLTEQFVKDRIKHLEDERLLMVSADRSSIDILKDTILQIEKIQSEMPSLAKAKDRLDDRIEHLQLEWEPKLTSLVNKVSSSFLERFISVASDGQVKLAKSERFKNWSLQILVKFRDNSELKVLDHKSQSGGERAVTTIFFIMSLQGLTDAPFRVVDEINQGMDQKNEKLAHKFLVQTACELNASQYFLITPKLLTGLYYHPDMVVHCIFTGPFVPSMKENSGVNILDFRRYALGKEE